LSPESSRARCTWIEVAASTIQILVAAGSDVSHAF
jgi:hypothetical protein